MKYLLIIATLLILGCGNYTRKIQKTATTEKTDKVTVDKSKEEIHRDLDTVISIQREEVSIKIIPTDLQGTDSIVKKIFKKGNLTLTASYNKKTKEFDASAIKDSEDLHVQIHEVVKRDKDITTSEKTSSEVKVVNKDVQRESTFNWTKILIWCGVLFAIVFLIVILIKVPNLKK